MDERAWLTTTMPLPMLLDRVQVASARKWRLLLCACLRAVWDELPEKLFRAAVEIAEDLADGHASPRNLVAVRTNLAVARIHAERTSDVDQLQWTDFCRHALAEHPHAQPLRLPPLDRGSTFHIEMHEDHSLATHDPRQCAVIRDLFGNPYRPFVLDDDLLSGRLNAVHDVAREIYEQRNFKLMPVLADALEDAGCDEEGVLAHCRDSLEHFRGCWLMDALLGKEAPVD
jgi:hypothetical protein